MTSSERAIALVVTLAVVAGYIAGQAWPRPDANVTEPVALFCLLAVAALTLVVLHARRGRP